MNLACLAIGPLSKPPAGLVQVWNFVPQLVNVMAVPTPIVRLAGVNPLSVIRRGAGTVGQLGPAVAAGELASGFDVVGAAVDG